MYPETAPVVTWAIAQQHDRKKTAIFIRDQPSHIRS
jgi:hypothetical protein